MSGSYFTLNAKYNTLLALFNSFFPYPPSPTPYPPPTDVMTLSTAQTAVGLKTFSTLPQSSVTPTIGAQLVNKTYVDSLVPTPVNAVTIDGSQTLLTGIKTFTNLPACSAVPTSGSQLVNKTYVDGAIPATPNLSQVLVAGNSANATSINMNNNNITSILQASGQSVVLTNTTANTTLSVNSGSATTTTLLTKFNNGRTAQTGEAIRLDFNAKNSAGTEFNYGKIHMNTPAVTAGSERGRIDVDVKSSAGLTTYLSANGNAGSLQMTAPFLDMVSHPITAVTTITDNQALPFLPQVDIEYNTSLPSTDITAYNNRHQVLLRANPVPVINTLAVQSTGSIGSCNVLCSAEGNGYQWLGTNCGEVWCYDIAITNWTLVAQFNGAIHSLFYASGYNRLYIGGSFTACSTPSTGLFYGYVAYIPSPSTAQIFPDNLIWSGNSNGGFNGYCNSITGSGADYIYFGGAYSTNADGSLILNYFGCYDQASNVLSPIDNNTSNGFNGVVYNLDFLSGTICATGQFSTITTGGVPTSNPYCVVFAISGNSVSSVYLFDAGNGTLTSPISAFSLIKNNGSEFIVAINEIYASPTYGNLKYLIYVPLSSSSVSAVGANTINAPIGSFFYNPSSAFTEVLTTANDYYQNGSLITAMGSNYFTYRFLQTGQIYFSLQGTGTQWAFTGSTQNVFALQGGRGVYYQGTLYLTSVTNNSPQIGANLLLNWNTAYYIVVSQQGSWIFA
jgi:hypothetical protein